MKPSIWVRFVHVVLVTVLLVVVVSPTAAQTPTPSTGSGILPHGTVDMRRPVVIKVDGLGQVVQQELPSFVDARYVYRGSLLSEVTHGEGTEARTTRYTYNEDGKIVTITDALGNETSFSYDANGQVTAQRRPDGQTIVYFYQNGMMTGIAPPGRPAHMLSHNPAGLLTQYVAPYVPGKGSTATTYDYSATGQLAQISYPNGENLVFRRDEEERLIGISLPQGSITYTLSPTTNSVEGISGPYGVALLLSFDEDLVAGTTWTGTISGTVGHEYDSKKSHVVTESVPGSSIKFAHDAASNLVRAGDLTIGRDEQHSELIRRTELDGIVDQLDYNGFGELTGYSAFYGTNVLFSTQYARDRLGRISQKIETIGGKSNVYKYEYDVVGRLVQVKKDGRRISQYAYDSNGNRLSGPLPTQKGSYDDQDRLTKYSSTAYSYSTNGYLMSTASDKSEATYNYDILGNLLGVELSSGKEIAYVVDGLGRRVGKMINGQLVQGWLYRDELKPVAELDGENRVTTVFVYGTKMHVPDYIIKQGARYRVICDHLGSPRLVVNTATGQIAQRMDYDEFGNVLVDTNPGFQPFGFAGGIYDPDTNLVRFGVRDYDPQVGRWTAKDPLGFDGGDTNLYAYLLNDPVNYIDPSGFSSWWELVQESFEKALKDSPKAVVESLVTCWRDRSIQVGCVLRGVAVSIATDVAFDITPEGLSRLLEGLQVTVLPEATTTAEPPKKIPSSGVPPVNTPVAAAIPGQMTEEKLMTALLDASDLPGGDWQKAEDDASNSEDVPLLTCFKEVSWQLEGIARPDSVVAEVEFRRGEGIKQGYFLESISWLSSESDAEDLFGRFMLVVKTCDGRSEVVTLPGNTVKFEASIKETQYPVYGDEIGALRLLWHTKSPLIPLESSAQLVGIRDGNIIVYLIYQRTALRGNPITVKDTEPVVRLALAKASKLRQ